MSDEVTIEPTPLVWMGNVEDVEEPHQLGWAFFVPPDYWVVQAKVHGLSPQLDLAVRKPIVVMCPMRLSGGPSAGEVIGTPFCIDSLSTRSQQPWQVTVDLASLVVGQQPLITVAPSIHLVGTWHGWLEQGILHN